MNFAASPEVSEAEKQGFSAPDASWFRGQSIDYGRELLDSPRAHIYDYLDRSAVRALVDERRGPAGVVGEPAAADSVLALNGVNAGYMGLTVVHDVNLGLAPRECLALVGESGSGKTTLARTIVGLHRERSGEILLKRAPLAQAARSRPLRPPKSSSGWRTIWPTVRRGFSDP